MIRLDQPEKGHPPELLTAPGAVLILSEQLLAQPLSAPTAPGAVVEQHSSVVEQQLAVSDTAPGADVVLLLLHPANAERTATAASVVSVRIMLELHKMVWCVGPNPRSGLEHHHSVES